jgi:hypothetical protein
MKVTAAIRPIETRELEVEAPDYATGRDKLREQVPGGWTIIGFRPVRD